MKVTSLSALALPLFASLSSAFLVVDTIHHSEPSVWNYNEQKIRLVCKGCPWDGEGELSDLIFTVKAARNRLALNDVVVNTRDHETSNAALVSQVRHGVDPKEGKVHTVPVEFDVDLRGIATAVNRRVRVENAFITIKTVAGKTVDLQPLEIIHHVDGVNQDTISILRAFPGHQIACNTAACKAKQLANKGVKSFGFRITLIKTKIMGHIKTWKAGCHGGDAQTTRVHGHPHGGRPRPDMMHHGRPGHHGEHPRPEHHFREGHHGRPHHFRHGRHHGILQTVAIVLYPIFFGIAAGIFTSLLAVLAYKSILRIVALFKGCRAKRVENVEDVEAHSLLVDEKVPYDDEPPMYQDDAQFIVVVPAEKE